MRRYGYQCQTLFGLFNSFSLSLSLSLHFWLFLLSLSFFLLSFSASLHLLSFTSLPFFSSSFFLQSPHPSLFLSFFVSPFFFSVTLPLCFFFFFRPPCHSHSPTPWSSTSPWSSASPLRLSPWSNLFWYPSFFFFFLFFFSFFLRLWIPCDCDYGLCLGMAVVGYAVYGGVLLKILRVFFFFSFVVVFGFGICWRIWWLWL